MIEETAHHALPPSEPGAQEPTAPREDTADAAASNDAAGAEGHFAPAASGGSEVMATSPAEHDAVENLDMPEQTFDLNPYSVGPRTSELTPSQSDTADTVAPKDAVGTDSQFARAGSDSNDATAPSLITLDAFGNPALPKQTSNPNPSPAEPGTTEPVLSQTDTAEAAPLNDAAGAESQVALDLSDSSDAAASKDAAGAESQVAPASSDSPEATATSQARLDGFVNPDLPEQTTDADLLSPAEAGTEIPTSPQDDTSDAGATQDVAGGECQIPAAPPNTPENSLPLTAEGEVKQPCKADDGGRFVPFIPQAPEPPAPKPAPKPKQSLDVKQKVWTVSEWVRRKDGSLGVSRFEISAPVEALGIFKQMADRGDFKRDLWDRIPFPTSIEAYGATSDLFANMKQAIKGQTHLPDNDCALLTFWVISTWLNVALSIAPGLAITGGAHEADVVLRTLRLLCYHPVLLVGMTTAGLDNIRWQLSPTLLIVEPALSARMAVLLGCSTGRGYLARIKADGGQSPPPGDYFGPKAIYLGEDLPANSGLTHYLRINASPVPGVESKRRAYLSEEMKQSFQNQLLHYRLQNLQNVVTSDFNASGLTPEVNEIATALGRCIVDARELQDELVSLLTPYSELQIAERLDDFGTLTIGAALTLCHQGKDKILVGEIAAEVNRIQKDRGERLQYSSGKVGRRLRRAGLLTRRLGAAGNGLLMDHATRVRIHEVAANYGCVGLTDDNENLRCPLCEQNK